MSSAASSEARPGSANPDRWIASTNRPLGQGARQADDIAVPAAIEAG